MIASLPMYDPPALQAANDRLWAAIRAELGYGPEGLTRADDLWSVWQSPDLLLGQTCGMPFRHHLHDQVSIVAAPDHGLPDVPAGRYQSVLVLRADDGRALSDLNGAHLAVNDPLSQSGWAAPMCHLERAGLRPARLSYTGAHAASALAVAEGRADLAGLDAVTWQILHMTAPDLTAALRVLDRTDPSPALPFITAQHANSARLRAALEAGIAALEPTDRQALRLFGVVEMQASDYRCVADPTSAAVDFSISPT